MSLDPWSALTLIYSNLLIAVSYFIIPLILVKMARSRGDLKSSVTFWLFFGLNVVYGLSKVVLVWNICHTDPIFGSTVRIVSALAASGSVLVLWTFLPKLTRLPSIQNLEDINRQLEAKVTELDEAYKNLETERDERIRVQASVLQTQKMDAIGQLTGGIAHEFNNLLLTISGNLELIKRTPSSDKLDRWVKTGLDAVDRAAHLTAQLLTFSHAQKLQLRRINIRPLLDNLKELIIRTIGPDIRVKVISFKDVIIEADPVQLELAILNLAINARDAMPNGGSLTIASSIADNRLEIDVTDTGHGIPEEFVTRVFEPFFTTKGIGKGVGLGLSMVHGVASQFGGNVYIKRTNSAGTKITISIPIIEEISVITDTSDEEVDSTIRQLTILLVDDEQSVRETLGEMLQLLGHSVHLAEDGNKALSYLDNNKADLILLDYAMPFMNGGEVSKVVEERYPDMPIAFVTGYSESGETSSHAVLKKPFSLKDINDLLTNIFEKAEGSPL